MNVHDTEKVENLLLHHGWTLAEDLDCAEFLVINTCSIREKAEHSLYSDLGRLREWKQAQPGRVLAVGGCVAQQVGDALLRRFPQVDFVFGTHNVRWVSAMAEAARAGQRQARVEETASLERFDLPERHPDFVGATPGRAFVTVMEGCDMFCSFCIVPRTRGREISRPADAILAEARQLASGGVCEVTLLGQTVNAYGRHDRRRAETRRAHGAAAEDDPGTIDFATLLGRLADIPGLARIRYTSPHPLFVDDALIRAHGEIEALCPHVHLPVQSGSDVVLERMRRRYTHVDYLRTADRLRAARPGLVLTSDVIVGFPGETDADFQATLALVRAAGFVDSFSFKYSPRPGTAAAELPDAVPPEVAQARLEELQALQSQQTLDYHRSRVGEEVAVLVSGESRRGGGQHAGRDQAHRVVNFEAPQTVAIEPGDFARVRIVEATPHSLIGTLADPPAGVRTSLKPSRGATDRGIRIQGIPG
ncbi:MAG: tRNA (N6-isopentenyl adenosine(37)-C2)-methylthiotransferase MiaB [Deltaproteobacteria bacterium]|nr:tRNA (N6-isopentenyl adenosine(37)-C2)-methylthiotransferase MiaB [Deltaproteobacteria bacterium]MBW2360426.1 tRNA (N6-isopentenyl adenosine(37)-C2)-methylthiotransferase MiaB [Deltaproteobacteria bacterium]